MESGNYFTFFRQDSFSSFEDMRRKRELCDLKITVGNQSFLAHRVILAAKIPYIRRMCFAPKMDEIDLTGYKPSCVEWLIHFAYGNEVQIWAQTVLPLLQVAYFLGVKEVSDTCVRFLMAEMKTQDNTRSCFQNWLSAEEIGHKILATACERYIRENFEQFLETENFTDLSDSLFQQLLSGEYLSVPNEEAVFEAIIKWVKVSPSDRQRMFPGLLREVRLVHLSKDYLMERVDSEELVRVSKLCRELMNEVKNFHIGQTKRSKYPNLKISPRRYIRDGIYIICQNPASGSSLYHYDLYTEKWRRLIPELQDDRVHSAAIIGNNLHIFLDKRTEAYNLQTLEYEQLEPTHEDFEGVAIASYKDAVYCFGSNCEYSKNINKVRCFDTKEKIWMKKGKMRECRTWAAAACVGEFIYVTGGCRGKEVLKSAEKFCPFTGRCMKISPMLTEREGHGCATMNGCIYVCGGMTANRFLSTVEEYDPAVGLWISVTSAKVPRSGLSLVSNCNSLYVLGGKTEDNEEALEVEIYDYLNKRWKSGFRVPTGFCYGILIPGPVPEWDSLEAQQNIELRTSYHLDLMKGCKRLKTM